MDLTKVIRTVPNLPKPGIMFRDITTLIANPQAFDYCITKLKQQYQHKNITKIAGIESRGFIFGAALAHELNLPFILIRKKGKLPPPIIAQEYQLEYGTDKIEIQPDAIKPNEKILIIDDLLATGGTMVAASNLVEKAGGIVAGCAFIINLPDLKGAEKFKRYPLTWLVEFEGD